MVLGVGIEVIFMELAGIGVMGLAAGVLVVVGMIEVVVVSVGMLAVGVVSMGVVSMGVLVVGLIGLDFDSTDGLTTSNSCLFLDLRRNFVGDVFIVAACLVTLGDLAIFLGELIVEDEEWLCVTSGDLAIFIGDTRLRHTLGLVLFGDVDLPP